ncbi:hypothetical protein U1Q18_042806 [Sarracenia purpurea var. burkii]
MAGLRAIGYVFDYDDYHSFVHGRLPYEILKPDPVLKGLLQSLSIRKMMFTNGDKEHVAQVVGRLGLEGCFDGVICFETLNPIDKTNVTDVDEEDVKDGFKGSKPTISSIGSAESDDVLDNSNESQLPKSPIVCKPFEDAFEQAFKIANINPRRTLFFDDSIRNLQTGKRMGLRTVGTKGFLFAEKRGDSYLQEGDPSIEGRPVICCQKEGNVAFGPKNNRGPEGEAICGIEGPMSPVRSSPNNKHAWSDPIDKVTSQNLESTRDNVGEPNLSRARNWKMRAREQEVRSKSKEGAIVIAAEVEEKKRKSYSNGAAVEK